MKAKMNLIVLVSALFISSCSSLQKGYVKFKDKPDEIIATQAIKDYIKISPNPSIVLKAPNSVNNSTLSDSNSYIYNAIEKELLLAGFDVRDRGLFNEVVSKSTEINYNELKKLTNTELLLELVNVSTDIEYGTNKYYRKDGTPKVANYIFIKYGAAIEFKLTIIETNQYAGSYSFYFIPCSEPTKGCECEVAYKTFPSKIYPHLSFCSGPQKPTDVVYEYVSQYSMEEFVREGVRLMISEIKK